jgi:hypothetical protein
MFDAYDTKNHTHIYIYIRSIILNFKFKKCLDDLIGPDHMCGVCNRSGDSIYYLIARKVFEERREGESAIWGVTRKRRFEQNVERRKR